MRDMKIFILLQKQNKIMTGLLVLILIALFFSPSLLASTTQDPQQKAIDEINQTFSELQELGVKVKIQQTVVKENAHVDIMIGTTVIGLQINIYNIDTDTLPETSKPKKTISESGEFSFVNPVIVNRPDFNNENLFIESKDESEESYLAQLRKQLKDNYVDIDNHLFSSNPAKSYTISGIGGVGKTQLAVAYTYKYEKNYDFVCWVDSESRGSIIRSYRDILKEIYMEKFCKNDWISIDGESLMQVREAIEETIDSKSDEDIMRLFVKKIPEKFEHWLLVYDNVKNADHMKRLTPQNGGHIIITSRNRDWSQFLELDVFKQDEAIDYLFKATGRKRTSLGEKLAGKIAEEKLGCLPLSLAQAASYMRKRRTSFQDYLDIFEERKQKLLEYKLPKDGYYEQVVMTTWNITMSKIIESFPQAEIIMNRCAYLAPNNIPLLFFTNNEFSEEEMLEAIEELDEYSMIVFKKDKISMHRLVQAIARMNLEVNCNNCSKGTIPLCVLSSHFIINSPCH